MTINLFDAKGTPLSQQKLTWKELVQEPISKLDDDAFTRVRNTPEREINLRTSGTDFVSRENESEESLEYRRYMNSEGSPSTSVAEGYHWRPGTELNRSRQAA